MRKRVWGVGLALLLGLLPPAAAWGDEVIVGTTSVWLKKDSTVEGDVVANEDAGERPTLVPGVELQIDSKTAIDGSASGDAIGTEPGASASGGFFCNELDGAPCAEPLGLPVLPLPPFEGTTQPLIDDVEVGNGGSLSLDAGAYRDLTVGRNGTVCFTGGVYELRSIVADRDTYLAFGAPTVIRLNDKLFMGVKSELGPDDGSASCSAGPSGITAADIVIYVGGSNGVDGGIEETPVAAHFGGGQGATQGIVNANLYVPRGTLAFGKSTEASGGFIAREVVVNRDSSVVEDSAFDFNVPELTADPQTVATNGEEPLEITLTGFDPEGEDLTFSLVAGPTLGSLGPIVPIVPEPEGRCSISGDSCQINADCSGGETCILNPVAINSATVTYTPPAPCPVDPEDGGIICPPDLFTFKVTDPPGNMSDPAAVDINAVGDTNPPPPDLEDVVANDQTRETLVDTPALLVLSGAAPCDGECDGVGDVDLDFSIVAGSGPSSGVLGPLTQGTGTPQRRAFVEYSPNVGFVGVDSFDFEVVGDTNNDGDTLDPGETDTATVTIQVDPPSAPTDPVADDVTMTTEVDTEISVGLSGTPGSPGGLTSPVTITRWTGERPANLDDGSRAASGRLLEGAGRQSARLPEPPNRGLDIVVYDDEMDFLGALGEFKTYDFEVGSGFPLGTPFSPGLIGDVDGIDFDAKTFNTGSATSGDQTMTGNGVGNTPTFTGATLDLNDLEFKPNAVGFWALDLTVGEVIEVLVALSPGNDAEFNVELAAGDPAFTPTFFGIVSERKIDSVKLRGTEAADDNIDRAWFIDDLTFDLPSDETGACDLTFAVETPPLFGGVGVISQTSTTTAQILYTPPSGFTGVDSFSYSVTDCFENSDIGFVSLTVFDSNACSNCFTLTIELQGAGVGDVTSNPSGILCPEDACIFDFVQGTPIVLQARPIDLSTFGGWGGACAGSSPLETLVLDSDKTCTATFNTSGGGN